MTRDQYEQQLVAAIEREAEQSLTDGWRDRHFNLTIRYGEWRAARAVAEAGCYLKWRQSGPCRKGNAMTEIIGYCPSCTATVKLDAMMEAK